MSLEEILTVWKEVRAGVIDELAQIPAEQFGFQPAPESRSVAGIIRHIVEVQKFSTGELCRPDTDFKRVPFRELAERHAAVAHTGGEGPSPVMSISKREQHQTTSGGVSLR